jgi:response regulator of citrate/malate metabolism
MGSHEPLAKAKKVLIVEDDHLDYVYLNYCVERSIKGGAVVTRANSIEEAKNIMRDCDFDLVLLDYHVGDRSPGALTEYLVDRDRVKAIALVTSAPRTVTNDFCSAVRVDIVLDKTWMPQSVVHDFFQRLEMPTQ